MIRKEKVAIFLCVFFILGYALIMMKYTMGSIDKTNIACLKKENEALKRVNNDIGTKLNEMIQERNLENSY